LLSEEEAKGIAIRFVLDVEEVIYQQAYTNLLSPFGFKAIVDPQIIDKKGIDGAIFIGGIVQKLLTDIFADQVDFHILYGHVGQSSSSNYIG